MDMTTNQAMEKRQSGFSLVELMVTIAVIAILAATAVPAINNWLPDYRLKASARDLYSRLQRAKIEAARSDAECVVLFDLPNNSFQLVSGGPDGLYGVGGDDVVLSMTLLNGYGSGVRFGTGNAPQSVGGAAFGPNPWDFLSGNNYLLFNDKGLVFESGYVYLRNDVGTCFAVGTPTLAGSVVLRKWYNTGGWQ